MVGPPADDGAWRGGDPDPLRPATDLGAANLGRHIGQRLAAYAPKLAVDLPRGPARLMGAGVAVKD